LPARFAVMIPVRRSQRTPHVSPTALVTPGGSAAGGATDLDNDPALQIALSLVGLPYGSPKELITVRGHSSLRPRLRLELEKIQAAVRATSPAAAAIAASGGAAIAAAELSGSAFGAIPGAVFDAALASLLLIVFVWRPRAEPGHLLPVLALVALIRPISLAAAVPALGPLAWYVLAGFPLLVGAVLATRLLDDKAAELHLRIELPRLDTTIAAAGIPAGLVGYILLNPTPLLAHPSAVGLVAMLATLSVFGGVLEELIFRGLVQSAAIKALGGTWTGAVFTAALSTALYWGSGSILYMLMMAVVGCAFGLAILRGASLWGVSLSHALMLVTIALLAQGLPR
jgi:uncharacterized protein